MSTFGMEVILFELVCPGSVKPDKTYNSLFPNKRIFFASRDRELMSSLRARREIEPILPLDTSDYPIAAYQEGFDRVPG